MSPDSRAGGIYKDTWAGSSRDSCPMIFEFSLNEYILFFMYLEAAPSMEKVKK